MPHRSEAIPKLQGTAFQLAFAIYASCLRRWHPGVELLCPATLCCGAGPATGKLHPQTLATNEATHEDSIHVISQEEGTIHDEHKGGSLHS